MEAKVRQMQFSGSYEVSVSIGQYAIGAVTEPAGRDIQGILIQLIQGLPIQAIMMASQMPGRTTPETVVK